MRTLHQGVEIHLESERRMHQLPFVLSGPSPRRKAVLPAAMTGILQGGFSEDPTCCRAPTLHVIRCARHARACVGAAGTRPLLCACGGQSGSGGHSRVVPCRTPAACGVAAAEGEAVAASSATAAEGSALCSRDWLVEKMRGID
jgi:hypothetical protein